MCFCLRIQYSNYMIGHVFPTLQSIPLSKKTNWMRITSSTSPNKTSILLQASSQINQQYPWLTLTSSKCNSLLRFKQKTEKVAFFQPHMCALSKIYKVFIRLIRFISVRHTISQKMAAFIVQTQTKTFKFRDMTPIFIKITLKSIWSPAKNET